MKNKLKNVFISSVLLITSVFTAFSQSDQYVGAEFNFGTSVGGSNQTAYGISYENRFSNHFGIESGLFSTTTFDTVWKYRYLEAPLLLKFYSKPFNLSLGAKGGLFTGAGSYSEGTLFWGEPYNISLLIKLSRDFELSRSLILEPEIICTPLNNLEENVYFNVGIKLKYLL